MGGRAGGWVGGRVGEVRIYIDVRPVKGVCGS